MSASVLELKIKALVEGLDKVKQLAGDLDATGKAAKEAGGNASSGGAGFEGLKDKVGSAAGGVKDMGAVVGGTLSPALTLLKDNVGQLVGAFTALAVAYGLKESADYAARTETLGITMNVVAKNAGYSAGEIGKYEKEVKGLGITTQGTREAITQMIQAGLEIGPKAEGQVSQVAKLARAAQDLAVVTGENSSATLTRLITNISQLDTVGLRYMGLTVNVEAAQRQFALSIGKTVDQLTQKQKAQAVMDESLKQAEKLSGAYEASMDSVGKKIQSLKRYQEELANDIGTKLLPAYGALVDAATNFLKDADKIAQGIDRSGASSRLLAEGVTSFGGAMGDTLNTVLGIVSELYPTLTATGKGILDIISLVIRVGTEILTLGHYTDDAGNKFTGLGQVIKLLLGTIALVLAGLKDGIDIVTATLYAMGGGAIDIIGKILSAFGKLVSYVNKDWGKSIQGIGESLQEVGNSMLGFAGQTVEQFGRGESAVGKYKKSLRDAEQYTRQLKEVTEFSKAEAEVLKLADAVRKNGTNTKEFSAQAEILSNKLKDMQSSGQLTTDQLGKLQSRLQRLSADDVANFGKAVNDAGLKVVELAGQDRLAPLNKEFDTAKASVAELGSNTKTTAAVMIDAFAKGVDSAKTLAELNQIGASLGDVKKITGDVKPALTEVGMKFDELFEKSLKVAKTEKDFADLTAEVQRLGKEGIISGDAVKRALKDIEEKSTGAAEALSRVAKQAAEVARSVADEARAHLDMIKAGADLSRASLDVMLKQNTYAREGTVLAREELSLAKINKQIAYEKSTEAKIAYDLAVSSNKLLIAQQEKINATKEVGLHLDKDDVEEYKNKAKAADETARLAEDNVNAIRKNLSEQQGVVLKLEETKVQQELVRDTVKQTGVEYGLNKSAIESANGAVGQVVQSQQSVTGKVTETRTEIQKLKGDIDTAGKGVTNLKEEFNKAAEAASNVKVPKANPGGNNSYGTGTWESGNSGGGSNGPLITNKEKKDKTENNTSKPSNDIGSNIGKGDPNNPMSQAAAEKRDQAVRKELTERYGGNGPVGKNDVTTKDGEHLTYSSKDHYVNSQGIIVDGSGKPSGTASDGHGAGVTDNDIANLLWDSEHGVTIEPTPENVKRAQTAFDTASVNLEVYQSHSGAFSNAGAASVMREYNRAKALLDKVKGAGMSDGLRSGTGFADGWGQSGFGGKRIDGSHRDGLDRVPKDGYVAELHKDEKVLTSQEADQYRKAPSVADLSNSLLQQIASASRSIPASTVDKAVASASHAPSKTIQVNFTDASGKTIPMTTAAGNEQSLLDLLARAKGVST